MEAALEQKQKECDDLRQENAKLREENAELRKENESIRKMAENILQKPATASMEQLSGLIALQHLIR